MDQVEVIGKEAFPGNVPRGNGVDGLGRESLCLGGRPHQGFKGFFGIS